MSLFIDDNLVASARNAVDCQPLTVIGPTAGVSEVSTQLSTRRPILGLVTSVPAPEQLHWGERIGVRSYRLGAVSMPAPMWQITVAWGGDHDPQVFRYDAASAEIWSTGGSRDLSSLEAVLQQDLDALRPSLAAHLHP